MHGTAARVFHGRENLLQAASEPAAPSPRELSVTSQTIVAGRKSCRCVQNLQQSSRRSQDFSSTPRASFRGRPRGAAGRSEASGLPLDAQKSPLPFWGDPAGGSQPLPVPPPVHLGCSWWRRRCGRSRSRRRRCPASRPPAAPASASASPPSAARSCPRPRAPASRWVCVWGE